MVRLRRQYKNQYPSVTEVIGILRNPTIEQWFKRNDASVCDEKSDRGKLIGSEIHNAIEEYILTGSAKIETEYIDEVSNGLKSFMLFKKENPNIILRLSEIELTSMEHKFNGQLDAPKPPSLYDWKSTNCGEKDKPSIYWEHRVQVSAYVHLWNENNINHISEAHIVAIAKDKVSYNIDTIYKEEIDDLFNEVFLPALKIKKYKKERHFYGKPVASNC